MDAALVGRWRLAEMELWDQQALDLVQPAFLSIEEDGTGLIGFIAISGTIDCHFDGENGCDFSWEGADEGSPVSGRGHARLTDNGDLVGRIFFHLGDHSSFVACRAAAG